MNLVDQLKHIRNTICMLVLIDQHYRQLIFGLIEQRDKIQDGVETEKYLEMEKFLAFFAHDDIPWFIKWELCMGKRQTLGRLFTSLDNDNQRLFVRHLLGNYNKLNLAICRAWATRNEEAVNKIWKCFVFEPKKVFSTGNEVTTEFLRDIGIALR